MCKVTALVDNMEQCIKIGKNYLFDPVGYKGYLVVRDDDNNVIGFKYCYYIEKINNETYSISMENVPLGIIRKSLFIIKRAKKR